MDMEGHHLHDEENLDPVWKGLTALSGVYIMFLIEHFLTLGKMYKDKKQKVRNRKFPSSHSEEAAGLTMMPKAECSVEQE